MPRKTDGEKIDELEKIVATLVERVDNVRRDLDAVQEFRTKHAILDERIAELKRQWDEASSRRWSLLPPLVGGIIGGILGFVSQLIVQAIRQ